MQTLKRVLAGATILVLAILATGAARAEQASSTLSVSVQVVAPGSLGGAVVAPDSNQQGSGTPVVPDAPDTGNGTVTEGAAAQPE